MRTAPPAVLLSVLVPWASVALPVVSLPHGSAARGRAGVPVARPARDRARRRPRHGAAEQRPGLVPGPRGRAAPRPAVPAPGRPEVLVTRTGVPRPSTCSASPGGHGRSRPTSPCWSAPTATPAGPAGRALDPAATPGRREARDRPARHRAAVGRRRRRLPGAGRRPPRRPAARPAGRPGRPGRARTPMTRSAPAGRCSRPQAAAGQPAIFTRAQWGADESHPRRLADRTTPRSAPASCTTPPAPTATPRRTVPEDPAGDLRVPRQGQPLVGHRLQLPGRPVRPALGGPVRRHGPSRRRCAHRRLQRRHRSRCPRSATSTRSPRRRSWSTRSRG